MGRYRDYRDVIESSFSAHPSNEIKAIFTSKIDVEQNHIGKVHRKNFVARFQVRSRPDFITLYLQPVLQEFPVGWIIFDNEDAMLQEFTAAGVTTRSS
jgi:hypothetical protein